MKLIRYNDLVAKGIVNSRMTLKRLIDLQGFPAGVLITPNARAWNEAEVDAWTAVRPSARKSSTRKSERHSGARLSARFVTYQKRVKPADVGASNRLRKHAHLGNPRRFLANTSRPFIQPLDDRDSFVSLGDVATRILAQVEGRR
jgi:predicted DNA-binding transcriptional regulator AlpA